MKKLSVCFLLLAVIVLLGACSASNAGYSKAAGAVSEMAMDTAEMPMAVYEAAAEEAFGTPVPDAPSIENPNRKLIKTVYLQIETKEFDSLLTSLNAKVSAVGGYVENSDIYQPSMDDDYSARRSANFVTRIPSSQLNTFVNAVEGFGNVTNKSENVQDVTLNYTDVESHKKSLEIERDRLNELIGEAEDVDAIIALETRLSEIRYQLDSYESQLRTYDNQVDYSTVTINISEVVDYTPQVKESVWERISTGFRDTIKDLGQFFEDLFVAVIVLSPVLLLLAGLVVAIILIIRAIRRKAAAKKAGTAGRQKPQDDSSSSPTGNPPTGNPPAGNPPAGE